MTEPLSHERVRKLRSALVAAIEPIAEDHDWNRGTPDPTWCDVNMWQVGINTNDEIVFQGTLDEKIKADILIACGRAAERYLAAAEAQKEEEVTERRAMTAGQLMEHWAESELPMREWLQSLVGVTIVPDPPTPTLYERRVAALTELLGEPDALNDEHAYWEPTAHIRSNGIVAIYANTTAVLRALAAVGEGE